MTRSWRVPSEIQGLFARRVFTGSVKDALPIASLVIPHFCPRVPSTADASTRPRKAPAKRFFTLPRPSVA
eukprot:3530956-Pyramimonas_sp.AAC.1